VAALERKVLTLEADLDTHRTEIRDLRSALAALDANMPAPAAEGEAPVAKAPVPADLERHFQTFMSKYEEEKAARDRRAWAERAASGFLRRVENVSDDQRKAFTNYVVAYWDERRKITREKYPTPEERQAATEALAAERNVKLQEIFDPAQYAQVSEMFGWMDRSGGRTPRGNRPRR